MGHVNSIPTMQFLSGISRNTQSMSYMLSLTVCDWEFQNIALWDTNLYALMKMISFRGYGNLMRILQYPRKGHAEFSKHVIYPGQ